MNGTLLLFVVAAAIGELLPFPKPRGRDLSIAVAVVASFALLGAPITEVMVVAVGGWLLAALSRTLQGRRPALDGLAISAGSAAVLVGAASSGEVVGGFEVGPGVSLGAVVAVSLVIILGLPIVEAWELSIRRHTRFVPTYRGVVRDNAHGAVALAAAAALGASVHELLGVWSVPLVLLPVLAARVGLARYAEVTRTYDQTVRAMSRLPEELGTVARGHGVRVGALAAAVAREIGLDDLKVADIERAAHLHELGQIRADLGEALADRTVASAGAAIIREAGALEDVAALIEHHRDPYRVAGRGESREVTLGSRILRSVCEFDRAAVGGRDDGASWLALETLHQGSAYDHDPMVLRALTSVLAREGRLGQVQSGSAGLG